MSGAPHISPDDLILFALQFLPEEEMAATRRHLLECEACRRQVGWIQGDLAAYAMTAEMQGPPAQARERLLHAVAAEKKEMKVVPIPVALPVATPTLVRSGREGADRGFHAADPDFDSYEPRLFTMGATEEPRRGSGWSWAGWAVAAAVAVAAGLQFQQRRSLQQQLADQSAKVTAAQTEYAKAEDAMKALTADNAKQVTMHLPASVGSPAAVQPYGHTTYIAESGALVFVASNLDPLAPQKVYELWLLPADKSAPMPAGTFKPDAHGNGSVVMPEMPKGVAAGGFAVTVEADGGSPKPTSAVVLAGA
jgi:anti-sigma-K factor RskA